MRKFQLSRDRQALLRQMLQEEGMEHSSGIKIQRRKDSGPVPLSFAQQRLWFLDQLVPGNPFYNLASVVRLMFPIQAAALRQSLNHVIQRHEVLRTVFTPTDGQPLQIIQPDLPVNLPIIDLQGLPASQREAKATEIATEEALRSFDLAKGPLLRASLLKLGAADFVFLLTMHHIISDAWSLEIFARELNEFYTKLVTGKPHSLPELPVQYADYAIWQREWLSGEVLKRQLEYWKEALAGLPMVELPTDHARPAVQSFRGAQMQVILPRLLSQALRELSNREGVTLFMALLAAFQTLLYRYTGQEDIVVGVPIAGRNRAEIEHLIGFFVNSLVFRTDISGNPSFRELLSRVHRTALEAYSHQDLPFEKLVDEMQLERDLSRNPLFQVTFQLQQATQAAQSFSRSQPSLVLKGQAALFDLSFRLWDTAEGITGVIEFNTDLFEEDTIVRMAANYRSLLEGIIRDPHQHLAELALLDPAEEIQLLSSWTGPRIWYPSETCLHRLFEAQVERTPDAIAVIFEQKSMIYKDLNWRASQLAGFLRRLGVRPEVFVGIYMERSLEMVVALLGVLKAGAAYVPLDPSYPSERLDYMITDTRAPVILTQQPLVDRLPKNHAKLVCLDTDWDEIEQGWEPNLPNGVSPDHPAYVIYTSGSTGRPKGVVISHRGICNHMLWMRETFPLNAEDRVLQKTPFSFDASVWEFYAPLIAGAELVMALPDGHSDSTYLVKTIAEKDITTLQVVPTMLRLILEEPELENCKSLRRVFCGGESLPAELREHFFARLDSDLYNLYGPTEASIDTTFWRCAQGNHASAVPIGTPIANTQVYVLDRNLQVVPAGVPGELYIGGAGLARGYHRQPGLTAEKFIPNPFDDEAGTRLYKTGDLVRSSPDGVIEFLGRLDHQVKLRGFRLELEEIEAVLNDHPDVQECVVMAREDIPGDQRLAAYYTLHPDSATSESELHKHLRQRLPEYMIPGSFMKLDHFPLAPNGKIDRRTLPAPASVQTGRKRTFMAPRNSIEEELAALWAEVLGLEQVGIHDNFFEIGGHSLLATQLISRMRRLFQIEVPLRRLFETPTIADFAEIVSKIRGDQPESRIAKIAEVDEKQLLDQLDQLSDEDIDYWLSNMPVEDDKDRQ